MTDEKTNTIFYVIDRKYTPFDNADMFDILTLLKPPTLLLERGHGGVFVF